MNGTKTVLGDIGHSAAYGPSKTFVQCYRARGSRTVIGNGSRHAAT